MNIIFFGSSDFAVPSLKALISSGHTVACVVTQPDRKKGRGLSLEPTAIKQVAQGANLEVYQPERINTKEAKEFLKGCNSDLFVVIAYGQLLSQEILDIPGILSVNLHASLLPFYRGAAPINWAIIRGEVATGITVIKMVKEMDAGPIILQKKIHILGQDSALTLEDKLAGIAADSLLDSLGIIESGNYKLTPQEQDKATFAPKLKKDDGLIDWDRPAQDIHNLVRGCLGWPGAFTHHRGKILKIFKTSVFPSENPDFKPGEILDISEKGILTATAKDNLLIEELQPEGKRIMKAKEFIIGHKISRGEFFR